MPCLSPARWILSTLAVMIVTSVTHAADLTLFDRDNLVAWCIVPFDAKKRSPEERVAMLKKLGFKKYAYDWRAEHLPTFDRELVALKKAGIELTAVWFPAGLNAEARVLLDGLKKHGIKTQLWITMGGGGPAKTPEEQAKRVRDHAAALRPIVEEAGKQGCTVALYNHGSWFGEPENQVAIIRELNLPNVGIVYNLHHGHDHLDRLPALLTLMKPYLLGFNLNGMFIDGERKGKKIVPLGQGDQDLKLLRLLADSGWKGPVGILGHTNDDAEERLSDNLAGLAWLVPQLAEKPAGPKPVPLTYSDKPVPTANATWIAAGKAEYRTPPITVECRATLQSKSGYNILIASDTKASAAHWELFTMPGTGFLTAYFPGRTPDHVRSKVDITDRKPHLIAMHLGEREVKLFVDGEEVAQAMTQSTGKAIVPGDLAFGRLVEGGIGCDGKVEIARLSAGLRTVAKVTDPLKADETTLGRWEFTTSTEAIDGSRLKNPAKPVAGSGPTSMVVPPGPNLISSDRRFTVRLIDRSDDDAYMAVKADGTGRLFVGGREKIFVFTPEGDRYRRTEILQLPPDSIVIGLEYRGDDLYILADHGLYLVPGGRVRTTNLVPKRILWGVPLDFHVSFHCLAWGPEGDLYLSHGDPLLGYGDWSRPDHHGCWTLFAGPKGEKVSYTGSGAILRMRPDGSNPRVLAGGLRGPVGLIFDRDWNLFTNDNDHESLADRYAPARLLHVTPQAHFGWPRGWMAQKSPERSDLLACLHGQLGRGVPCDLTMFDESGAGAMRGQLLMARWDRSAVTGYRLEPRGASFSAPQELIIAQGQNNLRPTGVTVDRTGRLFITGHYLAGNVVSPHAVSDLSVMNDGSVTPIIDETQESVPKLWELLGSDSRETRHRAHTELLRRGSLNEAVARLKSIQATDPSAVHLPYLAAATGTDEARQELSRLAGPKTPASLRRHALRALTEFHGAGVDPALFVRALTDADPVIQLQGLTYFHDSSGPIPTDTIAALAGNADPVLRQSASTLLGRRASLDDYRKFATATDPSLRLGAVLAIQTRLTLPPPTSAPPTGVNLHFPNDSAFFSSTLHFADSPTPVKLKELGPVGSYTTAQKWAAIAPSAEEQELFQVLLARIDDDAMPVREQAIYALSLLKDPRSEPKIATARLVARTRGLTDRPPLNVSRVWQLGPIPGLKADQSHPLEQGLIDLSAPVSNKSWTETAVTSSMIPPAGSGQVYRLLRVQSRDRQFALVDVQPHQGVRLWHNSRPLTPETDGRFVVDLQPGGNDLLIRSAGEKPLSLAIRVKGVASIEFPEKNDGALLAERLRSATKAGLSAEFLSVDWTSAKSQGNVAEGRKLFGSLGCAKCHAITASQPGGGAPSLAEAGKRFTPAHLAESVLIPDRLVADEFRATKIVTVAGQVFVGLQIRETNGEVELLLPDTTRKVIKLTEIEDRSRVTTSAMPAGLVKTPAELRDLIAYLLSDRPTPP